MHAAARELSEELGVGPDYLGQLTLRGDHVVKAGDDDWTYTSLAADGPAFTPRPDPVEVTDARWFTAQELHAMASRGELHPGLARALPDLLDLFRGDHDLSPYSGLTAKARVTPEYVVLESSSGVTYRAPAPHAPLNAPFGARLVDTAFGEAVWGDVHRNLSPAELSTGQHYIRNGYVDMNHLQRTGELKTRDPTLTVEEQRRQVMEHIEILNDVLHRRPLPVTIDTFRVLNPDPGLFSVPIDELPGTVQRDRGFFSTSIGDKPDRYGEIILHLRVMAGTPAFYMQLLSGYKEKELLLGSDVSWYVEDVRRKDGQWHVYGWVLPPEK